MITNYIVENGFIKFYKSFIEQLKRTAWQPELDELTDVIGQENWKKFIEIQNGKRNVDIGDLNHYEQRQEELVEKMKEYARRTMARRIGNATRGEQKDVLGKQGATAELMSLQNEIQIGGKV